MPGAPCEDPNKALRTMDFPSKDRFLFVADRSTASAAMSR